MGDRIVRRVCASALATVGLTTAVVTGGGAVANAAPPTSTGMQCSSLNPLFWAPSFTWSVRASTGGSQPPGGTTLEPALLLSGDNTLPNPSGGLPPIGINWYGTRVLVDWTNTTTGQSGRSVSDEAAWQQKPGVPINHTFTGTGAVDFTVTLQTGAGWWFVNRQEAVCHGSVSIEPF